MVPPDPNVSLDAASPPMGDGMPPPTNLDTPADAPPPLGRKVWIVAILLGVAAGVVAWGAGESALLQVKAEIVDVVLLGQTFKSATPETVQAAEVRTAIQVFSVFGALLGLAGGLSSSLAAGSSASKIRAAVIGLLVGGVSGGLAAFIVLPIHNRLAIDSAAEFLTSFVGHAGIWMPIGAAAGLGLALGLNRGSRQTLLMVVGGLLGAGVAAALYDVIGALAFPLGGTALPISKTPASRFLARILLSVLVMAAALILATTTRSKRAARPT